MTDGEGIREDGGMVCELCVLNDKGDLLHEEVVRCPSLDLTARQLCNLELLLNGDFWPLQAFLCRKDYDRS